MKKLLVTCIACIMSSGAFAALCWYDNGDGTKTCKQGGLACTDSSATKCSVEGETVPKLVGNAEPRPTPKAVREKASENLNKDAPAATPGEKNPLHEGSTATKTSPLHSEE
ncbi:MAG: hypothetical protein M0Q95_06650 [Porticoccaceae bacterium]|nr:hypothetical protein [Porticoccaceae bacterium]